MSFNPNTYTPETEAEREKRERGHLITEGKCAAVITNAECKSTKGGADAIVLSVEVISVKAGDAGKDSKFNWFCDIDNQFCAEKLYALWEVSGKGKWDIKDQALMTALLMGKPCIVDIKNEEFNGRTNSKIDRIKAMTEEQKAKYPVPDKWKIGEGQSFGSDDIPF